MIRPATYAIQQSFDEKGIKYRVTEVEESSVVEAAFGIDNGPSVTVRFISRDDDNDVAIRIFDLIKVTEDKRSNVLTAINQINNQYRYLKFVINDKGGVNAENDLYMRTDNVGEICVEMFIRCMQILKKAYPILMHAIW